MLLSVDPGTQALAYATWSNQGKLIECNLIRVPNTVTVLSERIRIMMTELNKVPYSSDQTCHSGWEPGLIVEMPVVYPHSRNKVDANDLVALGAVAGAVLGRYPHGRFVTPAEWKGQRTKNVTKAKINLELADFEKFVVRRTMVNVPKSLQHNVYDAIGIGLWFSERLFKRGV